MPSGSTQNYIAEGRTSVPGWFLERDAELFAAVSDLQHANGIHGDLLEIGVYQGASAILLGYLADSDECVILCDLFGRTPEMTADIRQDLRFYAGLETDVFLDHWHRFHADDPDEVIVDQSIVLHKRQWDRPVRFAHVDGGHTHEVVRGDVELAREVLAPSGGVVVFDDIRAEHTPGVAAAVWGAVECGALIPFAQTSKLYTSWDAEFAALAAAEIARTFPSVDHIIAGRRLVQVLAKPDNPPSALRRWSPPALVSMARRVRTSLRSFAAQRGT